MAVWLKEKRRSQMQLKGWKLQHDPRVRIVLDVMSVPHLFPHSSVKTVQKCQLPYLVMFWCLSVWFSFVHFFYSTFTSVICPIAVQSLIKVQRKGPYLSARFPAPLTPQTDTPLPNPPPVLWKRRKNQEPSIAVKIRCNFRSPYKPLFSPACQSFTNFSVRLFYLFIYCILGGFFVVIHCKIFMVFIITIILYFLRYCHYRATCFSAVLAEKNLNLIVKLCFRTPVNKSTAHN